MRELIYVFSIQSSTGELRLQRLEAKVRIHKDRQPDDMPDPFELLRSYGYVLHSRVDKADFLYVRREHAE